METLLISLVLLLKRIQILGSAFLSKFKPDRTTIIAIGDSWLNLTLFETFKKFKTIDTIDHLKKMKEFNVVDCAIPGYRLIDELKFKMFRQAADAMTGKYVILLSFGGNDLTKDFDRFVIGNGKKAKINKKLLKKFVTQIYFHYLKFYLDLIHYELRSLNISSTKAHIQSNTHFVIHGYDYFRPDVLEPTGKLHERFEKLFTEHQMSKEQAYALSREFVDVTNTQLKLFAGRMHNMTYLDLRDVLAEEEWAEAIHPTVGGYRKIAEKIAAQVRKIVK